MSGITCFVKDFKAKGQALGGQFKWPELIKNVSYSSADNEAIREANIRTLVIYGKSHQTSGSQERDRPLLNSKSVEESVFIDGTGLAYIMDIIDVNIADDMDDEAIHGRNRNRKKQAGTNPR